MQFFNRYPDMLSSTALFTLWISECIDSARTFIRGVLDDRPLPGPDEPTEMAPLKNVNGKEWV